MGRSSVLVTVGENGYEDSGYLGNRSHQHRRLRVCGDAAHGILPGEYGVAPFCGSRVLVTNANCWRLQWRVRILPSRPATNAQILGPFHPGLITACSCRRPRLEFSRPRAVPRPLDRQPRPLGWTMCKTLSVVRPENGNVGKNLSPRPVPRESPTK